jgi:hypothetical protein
VRVLYLDTNHLSRLARFPGEPECRSIRTLLDGGAARLALSFLHLQELSAPTFRSRGEVGALLDDLPIAWAPTPDVLFDREVRAAIRLAMIGSADFAPVFASSFSEALGAPPETDILVSQMLEALAFRPALRAHLQEAADSGARADYRFGRLAAVVKNPREPILAHIRDLNAQTTPAGLHLPRELTPEEIFERAGGVAGFPVTNVAHSLARTRLKDERFIVSGNDLFDEWHACYAPYSAAMALDRRTAARFKMTQLPSASRVTHLLAGIPALLAKF